MPKKLAELYDPNFLPDVSQETRTKIINAIGFDVENSSIKQASKFTQQELFTGLRYLLAKNKNLSAYRETSSNSHSSRFNPFFVDRGDLLFFNTMVTSSNSYSVKDSLITCKGERCDDLLCACAGLIACNLCVYAGSNTYGALASKEPTAVKIAKFCLITLSFVLPSVISWYLFSKHFNTPPAKDEDPTAYDLLHYVLPFLIGATCAVLTSYLAKKITCFKPKPSQDMLNELHTVKAVLEGDYTHTEANQEQCREFIKETVRCYIQTISKDPDEEYHASERTALLSNAPHATYFTLPEPPPPLNKLPISNDDSLTNNDAGEKPRHPATPS